MAKIDNVSHSRVQKVSYNTALNVGDNIFDPINLNDFKASKVSFFVCFTDAVDITKLSFKVQSSFDGVNYEDVDNKFLILGDAVDTQNAEFKNITKNQVLRVGYCAEDSKPYVKLNIFTEGSVTSSNATVIAHYDFIDDSTFDLQRTMKV